MAPTLRLDRGTLLLGEVPAAALDFFTWDDRAQAWRAPGHAYRDIMTALGQTPVRDEAAGVLKLELGYAREVQPYADQQGALEAWKKAGRRGVVVLLHRSR